MARRRLRGKGARPSRQAKNLTLDAPSGPSPGSGSRPGDPRVHGSGRLGLSLTEALAAGQRKDGGLTPAQLAWVLSQITIGDAATLPGGVPPAELRDYLRDLIDRLVRLAHP